MSSWKWSWWLIVTMLKESGMPDYQVEKMLLTVRKILKLSGLLENHASCLERQKKKTFKKSGLPDCQTEKRSSWSAGGTDIPVFGDYGGSIQTLFSTYPRNSGLTDSFAIHIAIILSPLCDNFSIIQKNFVRNIFFIYFYTPCVSSSDG